MKKKIIIILIVLFVAIGSVYATKNKVSFGGVPPQEFTTIAWNKPTTDAQWAEDVKTESFDIKSTGVLQTMIVAHTEKLTEEEKTFQKYIDMKKAGQDPVQYIYWQKRDEFAQNYPNMSAQELDSESLKAAQTEYNQELGEIEKIKQSLERMNKEVELRQKGFVIVDNGTSATTSFGSTQGKIIRHIHD